MTDSLLCYEIKSPELIALLEGNTDPGARDNRFGEPRHIFPENFRLPRGNYGGRIYYADNGFPSVRREPVQEAISRGKRPNPFVQRVPQISDAKMLLVQPKEDDLDDPVPSKSRALIQRVLSRALRRDVIFEGANADLVLHGHYLSDGHEYTPAGDLPPEFLRL